MVLMTMLMLMSAAKRIPTVTGNLTSGATYRGNWCGLLQNVSSGLVTIEKALKGQTITVGVVSNSQVNSAAMMTYNATTGAPNGGFLYTTWMTAAQMQGFSISWVTIPTRTSSQSDTTWLQQYISKVDFMSNVYTDTTQRESLGIGFTPTIVELSHLLVVPKAVSVTPFNLWNFAAPFSNALWGLLVATLFFNGVLVWLYNKDQSEGEERNFLFNVYWSLNSYSAVESCEGKNYKGMVLSIGFAFFTLIVAASYTANLASSLISSSSVSTSIQSIDDANSQGATLCLGKGASTVAIISQYYPKIRQVYFPTPGHIAAAAKGVECKGAVVNAQDWAIAQAHASTQNIGCALIQAGPPIRYYSGGYPYFRDFTTQCSSFLNGLLSPTFLSLAQSATIQTTFQASVDKYSDGHCVYEPPAAPSLALDISDLTGVWVVYCSIVGLVVVIHMVQMVVRYRTPSADKEMNVREVGGQERPEQDLAAWQWRGTEQPMFSDDAVAAGSATGSAAAGDDHFNVGILGPLRHE